MRHPDDSIATEAGFRVITVDRPGYGMSDFLPDRTFQDWPQDISQLADHLHVKDFRVVGFSGGGPYALATGLHLKERVMSITLVSSVGPLDTCMADKRNGLVQMIFRLGKWAPWLLTFFVKTAVARAKRNFDGAYEWAVRRLPECDRSILLGPDVRVIFRESLTEAFHRGNAAFLHEVKLLTRPWELLLEELSQPVLIWHGEEDGFSNGHALAALLPGSRATFLPEGHVLFFSRWQEILEELKQL